MGIRRSATLACAAALLSCVALAPAELALADEPSAAPVANIATAAPAAVAPAAPQNLRWERTEDAKAKLSWTPSPTATSASHYRVQVTFDKGQPYVVEDITDVSAEIPVAPGASATAMVTDIEQSTEATSPKWQQPAIKPGKVQDLNLTARDMNYDSKPPAARAVWMAPESDGGSSISAYVVQLFAGQGSKRTLVDSSTVDGDTFSHTFSNLEFETYYTVGVTAKNAAGSSSRADSNTVETVAEPQASPSPTPSFTTPSASPTPSATPSPTRTSIPAAPSPTPSTQADRGDLIFVAFLPIIVLLLLAAIAALIVLEVRFRRQRADDVVQAHTAAHTLNPIFKEPQDDDDV